MSEGGKTDVSVCFIIDAGVGDVAEEGGTAKACTDGVFEVKFEFVKNSLGISVMLMKANEFLAFVDEDLVVENGT